MANSRLTKENAQAVKDQFGPVRTESTHYEQAKAVINGIFLEEDQKGLNPLGEALIEFLQDHLEDWVRERSKEHSHGQGR
jgi:hypothetical protein